MKTKLKTQKVSNKLRMLALLAVLTVVTAVAIVAYDGYMYDEYGLQDSYTYSWGYEFDIENDDYSIDTHSTPPPRNI